MAKKNQEEALNLDNILFKCRDILRQARNSGSFFEKRDMMLTLVFLRFIGEKFEDGVENLRKKLISEGLDDCITINDIKVIQKEQDITVSLPRRRNEDGIYKEIVSPANPEAKEMIRKTVLEAYETYLLLCKSFEA